MGRRCGPFAPVGSSLVAGGGAGHGAPVAYALMKLLHYLGFGTALGASLAIQRLLGLSRKSPAPLKLGIESGARKLAGGVEIAGLFVAMIAGVWGIVLNPSVFKPAESGAGPWVHIKLGVVLALLVVAHLRMFKLIKLVKTREAAGSEADCDQLLASASTLGLVDLLLYVGIISLATLRFAIFG